ncbi:MAG: LytTR family transcriptional regulator [Clostridia bacterium]|nr:LytTR family transcriptional regulator [Clostridia bacterium]
MKVDLDQFIVLLKKELGLMLSISFGVFLFVLFFRPFPMFINDADNRLLIVAGLSGIIFLLMIVTRITLPWLVPRYITPHAESELPPVAASLTLLVLSSVAFAFYLHYVAMMPVSFVTIIRIVLLCAASVAALRVTDVMLRMRLEQQHLLKEKKHMQVQLERYEDDFLNKIIELPSDNLSENLTVAVADVVFVRSADNYVEVVFRDGEQHTKKLLRNTLKNVGVQLQPYSNFLRCHRTSIVNCHYMEKLVRQQNNYYLTLKNNSETLPVSRQYLMSVRESL